MDIGRIFKEQCPRLIGLLRRRGKQHPDAEDIAQDCFVRLLVYVKNGEQVANPEALLARAATNREIDCHRRAHRHLYEGRPAEELPLSSLEPGPDEVVDADQCLERLARTLQSTVGQRACDVYLRHCLGMTHDEIAKAHHMSTDTVARDIAKAIHAIASKK